MSNYTYETEKACRALYDLTQIKNNAINTNEIEKLVNIVMKADNAYYYFQVAEILPSYTERMFNLLRADYLNNGGNYTAVGYWLQNIDYEGNVMLKRDILLRDELYDIYIESEAYEDEDFMVKFNKDLTKEDFLGIIV